MSTQESVRRKAGTVEESEALRIDQDKAEQIVEAFNTNLAASYVAYHQVRKHHWNVEGAEFLELHEYLGEIAEDLEAAADAFAERAQALGGVPLSGGATYEAHAPVEPEGDDVYDIRTSLENDMEMLGDIIETMRDHIGMMEDLGDYTSSEILREHYLEDDTLVLEEAVN